MNAQPAPAGKTTEPPGGASKRRAIWRIPDYCKLETKGLLRECNFGIQFILPKLSYGHPSTS